MTGASDHRLHRSPAGDTLRDRTETAEWRRLHHPDEDWRRWGPYLAERAWGTVREDYSADGSAWSSFPHDHARSRTYRWNEDGLGGLCDRSQYLCLAVAVWNEHDPILKERLFGLTGPQGNHGEDAKEEYAYLDGTPTASYLKMTYCYPTTAFPYEELVAGNAARGREEPEYELLDTGVLDAGYFAVDVEYAKASDDEVLGRITVTNRGEERAVCHVLPHLWFRNTWSWGYEHGPMDDVPGRPELRVTEPGRIAADHPAAGRYEWAVDTGEILVCENETNHERLSGTPNERAAVKDGIGRRVVDGDGSALADAGVGTKAAGWVRLDLAAGESRVVRVRLARALGEDPFADFDDVVDRRVAEADEFYEAVHPPGASADLRSVQRQACAGLVWTQQLYYWDVPQWLDGDPAGPEPPAERRHGRNAGWRHFNAFDVLSMPDAWEYPWFAAWDLAFHCVPLARIDPSSAKRQLTLLTRVWYMHPNGQLPAYEWSFDDVNPPVHAWAAWDVYEIDASLTGSPDVAWLEALFHKLLLDFTWWVNRKDPDGNNVFQGGFLGLDNVSVVDRSELPGDAHLDQSDATAWMAFYTLAMLRIALELATHNPVYQAMATKFYEHFLAIARALTAPGHDLWDAEDGFFYDVLRRPDGSSERLRVRSVVGLLPLVAVAVIDEDTLERLPDFARRMRWLTRHRPGLAGNMASIDVPGQGRRVLLSPLTDERLRSVLRYLLDEAEFLSPHGVRSLSKAHAGDPFELHVAGAIHRIGYEPAESRSPMFGGNSNWRGPVWLPVNHLIVEALEAHHRYRGDGFTVEYPTGSGRHLTLAAVAERVARRVIGLFEADDDGRRRLHGDRAWYASNLPGVVHFPEYFDGDDGTGLGAMHQTGWTALVADLVERYVD